MARGQGGRGRRAVYTSKPKSTKEGLCKELEHQIFDYGVTIAANIMRATQEKIAQYLGVKYGEDISNELTNKTTVVIPPPVYSQAILQKHQEWEAHVCKKQTKVKAVLEAKLRRMQALDEDEQDEVEIADLENQINNI